MPERQRLDHQTRSTGDTMRTLGAIPIQLDRTLRRSEYESRRSYSSPSQQSSHSAFLADTRQDLERRVDHPGTLAT